MNKTLRLDREAANISFGSIGLWRDFIIRASMPIALEVMEITSYMISKSVLQFSQIPNLED
jgi:hypothetical protein